MSDLDSVRHRVWGHLARHLGSVGLVSASYLALGCDGDAASADGHAEAGHVEGQMGLPPRVLETDGHAGEDHDDHDPLEHADEERERCPSGVWCATIDDASLFSVDGAPTELDCPKKLIPNLEVEMKIGDARFNGFSRSIDMRGDLDRSMTLEKRRESEGRLCCYDWLEHCLGRPPLTATGVVLPQDFPSEPDGPHSTCAQWRRRAALEWLSVASFQRMAVALAERGAPVRLVEAHFVAAEQERNHAQMCAARAGISLAELGSLPVLAPLGDGLLVEEALVAGALGESVAVLEAIRERAQAARVDVPLWSRIIEDESGHAALGLLTLRWWSGQYGPQMVVAALNTLQGAVLGEDVRAVLEQVVQPQLRRFVDLRRRA